MRAALHCFFVRREYYLLLAALAAAMAALPPLAAPVAPAPIAVTVTPIPVTPFLHAFLDSNIPLVLSLPFVWEAVPPAVGAPPQVRASQRILLSCFIWRCSLDQAAASLAFFPILHVFNLAITGAAWGRILTELVASGMLATPATDFVSLVEAILGLTITNPANLVLSPADFILGEDFNIPGLPGVPGIPGVAGRAARGRRGARGYVPAVAAIAAVPAVAPVAAVLGPADLSYFTFLTLDFLYRPMAAAPLANLARLARLAGDALTRAARLGPLALPRLTSSILRPNLEKRIFGSTAGPHPDAVVALRLPEFLEGLALPPMWHSGELDTNSVLATLSDTLRYKYGSDEDRRAVETSRLPIAKSCVRALGTHRVAPKSFLARTASRQTLSTHCVALSLRAPCGHALRRARTLGTHCVAPHPTARTASR